MFRIEQFENELIKLSSKSKVDLLAKTKLSTARDFRILQKVQEDDEEEEDKENEVGIEPLTSLSCTF